MPWVQYVERISFDFITQCKVYKTLIIDVYNVCHNNVTCWYELAFCRFSKLVFDHPHSDRTWMKTIFKKQWRLKKYRAWHDPISNSWLENKNHGNDNGVWFPRHEVRNKYFEMTLSISAKEKKNMIVSCCVPENTSRK